MARYLRATPATPSYFQSQVQAQANYVSTLAVDDLSYSPSEKEKARDDIQLAATGRRNWKTLRGKGEAVWPPHLEAALLEALEKYNPEDHKQSKSGRFPLRNKFISDYIFELTGKRRTAKQVGSRLQQLRDTCKDERILTLVCSRRRAGTNTPSGSDSETASIESSPILHDPLPYLPDTELSLTTAVTYVNIAVQSAAWRAGPPAFLLVDNTPLTPVTLRLSVLDDSLGLRCETDPQISFTASSILSTHSAWTVYQKDTTGVILHKQIGFLTPHALQNQSPGWTYSTKLVPGFWKKLSNSPYPAQYTIVQDLFPIRQGTTNDKGTKVSVVYKFSFSDTTTESMEAHSYNMHPSFNADSSAYPTESLLHKPDQLWIDAPSMDAYHGFGAYPPDASYRSHVLVPFTVSDTAESSLPPPAPRGSRADEGGYHDNSVASPRVIRAASFFSPYEQYGLAD